MIDLSFAGLIGAFIGTAIAALAYVPLIALIERHLRARAASENDDANGSSAEQETLQQEISLLRRSVLAADIIGLQTYSDVRNFLLTCEENMGLPVDLRQQTAFYRGRTIWVRRYPISIDVREFERTAASPAVERAEREILRWRPEQLIYRVDRMDLSKNIIRGFFGYERLLPLINYENRQCGLLACKVLMKEGGVIACEAARHPWPPLHPVTRAGLIEIARRLEPLVLRWAR